MAVANVILRLGGPPCSVEFVKSALSGPQTPTAVHTPAADQTNPLCLSLFPLYTTHPTFGDMHPPSHANPRHRTRVTSCQLCRDRKLRCSRQFPCSNCTARGAACKAPQVQRTAGQRETPEKTPVPVLARHVSNDQLLKRLESLEALLATQTKQPQLAHSQSDLSHDTEEKQLPSNVQNLLSDALLLERHCMGSKAVGVSHS